MALTSNARQWVETWRTAGPILDRIRAREMYAISTPRAVEALAGFSTYARLHCPPKPTSGLVEQQRWFQRARS
jgi:hypothetical protein